MPRQLGVRRLSGVATRERLNLVALELMCSKRMTTANFELDSKAS